MMMTILMTGQGRLAEVTSTVVNAEDGLATTSTTTTTTKKKMKQKNDPQNDPRNDPQNYL